MFGVLSGSRYLNYWPYMAWHGYSIFLVPLFSNRAPSLSEHSAFLVCSTHSTPSTQSRDQNHTLDHTFHERKGQAAAAKPRSPSLDSVNQSYFLFWIAGGRTYFSGYRKQEFLGNCCFFEASAFGLALLICLFATHTEQFHWWKMDGYMIKGLEESILWWIGCRIRDNERKRSSSFNLKHVIWAVYPDRKSRPKVSGSQSLWEW